MVARRPRRRALRRRRLVGGAVLVVLVALLALLVVDLGSGDHGPPGATPAPITPAPTTPAPTSPAPTSPAPTSPAPTSPAPTSPAFHAVGITALALVEPGTGRRVPTAVRYPAPGSPGGPAVAGAPPDRRDGPYPLVVFSAGFDVSPEAYATLLDTWASAGYVVADPSYPATDPVLSPPVDESDIVNHPADLRFVVSALTGPLAAPLQGLVDVAEVGLIGHSDGGDVTLAGAANSCCTVTLVKAAVVLSGAELSAFAGSYFTGPTVPLLVVQGTADPINPPGCSVQLYTGSPQPKYYLAVLGADHQQPYLDPGPDQSVVGAVTTDFLNAYLKGSASARAALVADGTRPGQTTMTAGGPPPATDPSCPGAPGN